MATILTKQEYTLSSDGDSTQEYASVNLKNHFCLQTDQKTGETNLIFYCIGHGKMMKTTPGGAPSWSCMGNTCRDCEKQVFPGVGLPNEEDCHLICFKCLEEVDR